MDYIFYIAFFVLLLLTIKRVYDGYSKSTSMPIIDAIPSIHVMKEDPKIGIEKGTTSQCADMAYFHADIGTVYPLRVDGPDYIIVPFQKASSDIQSILVDRLKVLNPDLTIPYILDNWKGSDVFYVMSTTNGDFVGAVAVDRKNFEPFLSHLYVEMALRNKGYGERLIDHAIEYARAFKFNILRLWCESAIIPYYLKHGWLIEKEIAEKSLWIMIKSLS